MASERHRTLEKLRRSAADLEAHIKLARADVERAGILGDVTRLGKRSAADAAETDAADVDPETAKFDEEARRRLEELHAEAAELAQQKAELDRHLETLRTVRQTADRLEPRTITLMEAVHARDLAEFFETHGEDRVDTSCRMPAAFVTECMGGSLQTPGAVRRAPAPEDADVLERRLRAQREQLRAAQSVFTERISSLSRCIEAFEKSGNFNVPPAERMTSSEMAEQMMCPVGKMKACAAGAQCVALTELPPHANGLRLPLKQLQKKSAFGAFKSTGYFHDTGPLASINEFCLPCTLMGYARQAFAAIQINKPCSQISFPLSAVVECNGGFRRAYTVPSDTMPVAWPALSPHHFVPVVRDFVWYTVDLATGRREKHVDIVPGYDFIADVLFDPATYSCGADTHMVLPPRNPLITTTLTIQDPTLPVVLSADARTALCFELAQGRDLPGAIELLITEMDHVVRECLSASAEINEQRRASFAPYWSNSLLQAPDGLLQNSGLWSPSTHSVLAATMWRVGLALFLQSRPELAGNTNVNAFLNAHTALQKLLFEAWIKFKTPPSDESLFCDVVGVRTPESMCAVLAVQGVYPSYPVPFLSPAHQREVRVDLTHRIRTPPLEHVRRAVLPSELTTTGDDVMPRGLARAALAWLEARVPAEAPELGDLTSLSSVPSNLTLWTSRAVSLVALQTDFHDSVWLVGALTERWPWFARLAALLTAGTLVAGADADASRALDAGHWLNRPLSTPDPVCLPRVPADSPAWMHDLQGWRRFVATYDRCGPEGEVLETVHLGRHLYPDALGNLSEPRWRQRDYTVLAALRLRVYELQRLASKFDAPLRVAFEQSLKSARDEAREAADQLRHDRRDVATRIRNMAGDTDAEAPRSRQTTLMSLTPDSSIMDVAEKVIDMWPDADDVATEAVDLDTRLVESIAEMQLGDLMTGSLIAPEREWWMGVPPEHRNEIAYQTRCALFECLELAYQASIVQDASDAYWLCGDRPLDACAPLAGATACEDLLPDTSPWVGYNVLHDADRADFVSDIEVLRSWVPCVSAGMHKACYIRDWPGNHAQYCRHSEYAAWAAQALLTSVQGTYRHVCSTQRFSRVLELYASLRPQNSHTDSGREQMVRCLVRNTYKMLVAAREFQMVAILASVSQRDVIAAAWPNFPYVQRCWVPQQAERMRGYIRGQQSEAASERAVREMARDEERLDGDHVQGDVDRLVPRVFRHMPPAWPYYMLSLFCAVENTRHRGDQVRTDGNLASVLPPIVNIMEPEIKHAIARAASHTNPYDSISLRWFSSCGVSPRGVAQLVMMNALYVAQQRPAWTQALMTQMSRVDFVYAWTAMHVMVLHRDSQVLPVTWEMAQRQYIAAQNRANDLVNPPPSVFTHLRFCHLLGCAGVQSYVVPYACNAHYGAQKDMMALDLGRITCGCHKSAHMYDKLVRRINETPVAEMAASLQATAAAIESSSDPVERQQLQSNLERLRDKIETYQSTNVRATISVMMTRPCNEAPARDLRIVGAMVVRFNTIHARERPRVYTACPNCGAPTLYSLDRIGPNGFMCGQCNREMRWAEHGRWCISCGMVEQAEKLPLLTGEAEAEARTSRTEHQIQGSTQQARSLKAHLTRTHHDAQVKRQALRDTVRTSDTLDLDGNERDHSDQLMNPGRSLELETVVERREARAKRPPARRKQNTASELRLGNSLSAVHPMPLKTRMEPFSQCVVYDDRAGGHGISMTVSICRPCENRIEVPTTSLSGVLMQTQAVSDEIWVHGVRLWMGGRNNPRRPTWRYNVRAAMYASKMDAERRRSGVVPKPAGPVQWLSLDETQKLMTAPSDP